LRCGSGRAFFLICLVVVGLLAVPAAAGAYTFGPTVTVSVGDSRYRSGSSDPGDASDHQINVERLPLISAFRPTDTNRFRSATQTLPVCDDRLTLDAIGGTNTKIDYVEAVPVSLNLAG
jgi:hypothetical protein